MRAALHGRSMQEEARDLLPVAAGGVTGPSLWERSCTLFAGDRGVEPDLPPRSEDRAPPSFERPEASCMILPDTLFPARP
ncbi:MAG: hypothetical protein ACO33A_10040 [Hyphomonas sp.]